MIKGKIIKIIGEYEVLLDIGSNKDVKEGMLFVVYEEGEERFSPETNESLGKFEIKKGKVRITHVQEKFSKAISAEFSERLGIANLAKIMIDLNSSYTSRTKLNVNPENITPLNETSHPISIGDLVRLYPSSSEK